MYKNITALYAVYLVLLRDVYERPYCYCYVMYSVCYTIEYYSSD